MLRAFNTLLRLTGFIQMPENKLDNDIKTAKSGEPQLIDLNNRALIRVSGNDAAKFLQSQLTNDIYEVSEEQSQFAAWCSPKGRMLVIFRIFYAADGEYLLELPRSLLEPISKRLQMFILRSDVTLSTGDESATFGVTGEIAAKLFPGLPENDYSQVIGNGIVIARIPGENPRFQLAGKTETIQDARSQLENDAVIANGDLWRWLDIQASQPSVWPETQERFTPHMLNLDLLGGVSFSKGCYPGQEIVARTKFLGKVKQRMVRARTDAEAERGDAVFSKDALRQAAGYVVDAIQTPEGCDMLVTVKNADEESAVYLGAADGAPVELQHNG